MLGMIFIAVLMIAQVNGMLDSMCFIDQKLPAPNKPYPARILLDKSQQATRRACEVACADNSLCVGIVYNDPKCFHLGNPAGGYSCQAVTVSTPVSIKTDVCQDRTDITAELGNDPCAQTIFPENTQMNVAGVCPREQIIRGVNETGARITIDNHSGNILSYDSSRRMWRLDNNYNAHSYWLVAIVCALPISTGSCGCDPLPQLDAARYGIVNGVSAYVGPTTTCQDATQTLRYWNFDSPSTDDAGTMGPSVVANMHIECQAGIWLLTYNDNSDGWQITNASCIP